MKILKRSLLLLCSMFVLAGCGEKKDNAEESSAEDQTAIVSEETKSADDLIYENTMACIRIMVEEVNSEAAKKLLFSTNQELLQIAENIGSGDYTQPAAVYEIQLGDRLLDSVFAFSDVNGDELSPEVKKIFENRIYTSIPLQINAKVVGSAFLAATSTLVYSNSFVCSEITTPSLYLFYFENGNDVFVTCVPGKNDHVSLNTCFTDTFLQQGLDTEAVKEELAPLFAEYISYDPLMKFDVKKIR